MDIYSDRHNGRAATACVRVQSKLWSSRVKWGTNTEAKAKENKWNWGEKGARAVLIKAVVLCIYILYNGVRSYWTQSKTHNRGQRLCKWSPWDKHSDWPVFLLLCLNDVSKSWDAIDGHMSWLWGRRECALKQNAVKAARFRQRVKHWSAQRPHIRWITIMLYYEWVELEESEIDCYFSILTDHSKQFLLERIHTSFLSAAPFELILT